MKEKAFTPPQVQEIQEFLTEIVNYKAMMDIQSLAREASNVSFLWFKEFYLETCKQIQFPIATSLPWILAEYALDSHNPEIIQYIHLN